MVSQRSIKFLFPVTVPHCEPFPMSMELFSAFWGNEKREPIVKHSLVSKMQIYFLGAPGRHTPFSLCVCGGGVREEEGARWGQVIRRFKTIQTSI